jgi:hypothetical protein
MPSRYAPRSIRPPEPAPPHAPYDIPMKRTGLEVADDFIRWGDSQSIVIDPVTSGAFVVNSTQLVKVRRDWPETWTVHLVVELPSDIVSLGPSPGYNITVGFQLIIGSGSANANLVPSIVMSNQQPPSAFNPYEAFYYPNPTPTFPIPLSMFLQGADQELITPYKTGVLIFEVPAKDIQVSAQVANFPGLATTNAITVSAYAAPRYMQRMKGSAL